VDLKRYLQRIGFYNVTIDDMKQIALTTLVFIALLMVGCKSGTDVVGKWTGSMDSGATSNDPSAAAAAKMMSSVTLEFKKDQTFSMNMLFPFEGTWTQSGPTITMKMTKAMGMDVSQLKSMAAAQGNANTADVDKPMILTVSSDGQTLTGEDVNGKGGKFVFKRDKPS